MNFKCKINNPECGQLFSTEDGIFHHFKNDHKLPESKDEFPCPINNDCQKQYLQVRSARNHAKKCIAKKYVLLEWIFWIRVFQMEKCN